MRTLPLILAALSLSTPAAAQDGSETAEKRTVEGAQQFLEEFYSRANANGKANGQFVGGKQVKEKAGSTHLSFEGPIAGVSSAGRCKSAVTIFPAIKRRFGDFEPTVPIAENSGRLSVEVDWSAIDKQVFENEWLILAGGKVRETGRVNVHLATKGQDVVFVHASKESAERAAFAMQFLAEQCGFKTKTGF